MSRLTRWKSPTQQSNNVASDFRYPPLISTKTGIRLAKLQPGVGNKAISIELIDAYLTGSARVEYDALSYVWGPNERDKTVFCNGKRLHVTKTLIEALSRFRRPDDEVTLWIDQICICQERIKERNAQVQMMGDIFKSARKVIVWLGDDYEDSKAGMQLAAQLLHIAQTFPATSLAVTDIDTHGLPKQGSRKWKALAQILRRPWFWRTWIVQEVVLNPNVELVLGASCLTWTELEAIVTLLEGRLSPTEESIDQALTLSELPFSRINRIRLRHQRRSPLPRPASRRAWSGQEVMFAEPENFLDDLVEPDLLDLLLMSRSLGATDPRDKIYALLGLGKHSIDPDYSMSPESVFTDFALTTIGEVTTLSARRAIHGGEASPSDKEVRKAMIMLACAGRQNQKLDLPSWVPDWTTDIASRSLMFGNSQCFNTGGDRLGLFDWQPDFGLQLSGLLFDTVQVTGSANLQHAGPETPADMCCAIDAWWREASEIAVQRTVRSPGSSNNLDAFTNLRRSLSLCKHGYYIGDAGGRRRRESLLDEAELTSDAQHSALHTMTLGPGRGRVLIVSATGYVGLAPHGTREGDMLFVILGCTVPFVLRQREDAFELIGEAYVQGIMYGEALSIGSVLGVQDIMIR